MRHPRPATRHLALALVAALSAGIAVPAVSAFADSGVGGLRQSAPSTSERVIVRTAPGAKRQVAATIRQLGGSLTHRMRMIDSLVAQLPAGASSRLAGAAGVE